MKTFQKKKSRDIMASYEKKFQLATTDVLSHGCQKLVQALSNQFPELKKTIKWKHFEKALLWLREKRTVWKEKMKLFMPRIEICLPQIRDNARMTIRTLWAKRYFHNGRFQSGA
jgi:hypothetical protein